MNQKERSGWNNPKIRMARVLDNLSGNQAGIGALVKEEDKELMRKTIVDLAEKSPIEDDFQMFVCVMFHRLGLGKQRERLKDMTLDPSQGDRLRYLAYEILLHAQFKEECPMGVTFDGDTFAMFHELRTRLLLRHIFRDPKKSEILAESLYELEGEDMQIANFLAVEELRQDERIPAAIAYRNILTDGGPSSLSELALDAISQEGGIVGRSILQAIRSHELAPLERRRIQSRLAQWHYPERSQEEETDLEVLVSACDQEGRVGFFLKSKRANGRFDEFCLSANIVEGLESASSSLDGIDPVHPDVFGVGALVDFPPSVAAWLLMEHRKLRLTRGRSHLPEGEPIFARLEKIMAPEASVSLALAEPLESSEVASLLSERPYRSWGENWQENMGNPELKSRFEFMAIWHRFRGERRKAEVAALLSRRPEQLQDMAWAQSSS